METFVSWKSNPSSNADILDITMSSSQILTINCITFVSLCEIICEICNLSNLDVSIMKYLTYYLSSHRKAVKSSEHTLIEDVAFWV